MNMKHWWNDTDRSNWITVTKTCLSANSSTTDLTLWTFWDWTQATWWKAGSFHDPNKRPSNPVQVFAGPEISRRLRLPLFKTVGTWKWEGCQTWHWQPLHPTEIFLVLIFVRGWVDRKALGLCQQKIPMTPAGIEPATLLFGVQYGLNTNIN